MKLKKEHIQRIDSFLERLGCEYIDIRFEMVDHIATDIEEKIQDFDVFFKKDKFNGKFLRYMLSRKNEFETNYYQQSKKQYWANLWKILKDFLPFLSNLKYIFTTVITFIGFQYLATYNLKYTVIFIVLFSIIFSIYSLHFISKEFKKIGKIRVIYSYYSILSILFILNSQIPNPFNLLKEKYHSIFIVNFHFIIIVLNILILAIFIKNKNSFTKKYQFLLQ